MAGAKTEAVTPRDLLVRLADAADQEILIGGQALAIWVVRYDVPFPQRIASISNDVDFLASSPAAFDRVKHLAKVLGGQSHFPNERALTAQYRNVDVLHQLIGLDAGEVRRDAIRFATGDKSFLVMHPLHVLKSRLCNLHKLREKQNEKGEMQLRLAIDVGRAFLRNEALAAEPEELASGRSPLQHYVNAIWQMAKSSAGRKVAQRHALHVADAIDPSLIPAGPFWAKAWPHLSPLMSEEYSAQFGPPDELIQDERAALGSPRA